MNRKNILITGTLLLSMLAAASFGRPYSEFDVVVTRDLTGQPTPTRTEYLSRFPERNMIIDLIERGNVHRDPEGTVVLVINSSLYEMLEERFDNYAEDLRDEGYSIVRLVLDGGTPQELKDIILEEGGDDIVGAVLAGELPVPWYEHCEYFYNEEEPDGPRIIEYPIDLFYMDLDGIWEDTTGNGIYDFHHGEWEPDIWIGRLPGYNLSSIDEDTLVANYLDRVHAYRAGNILLPHRALNYIDDDWQLQLEDWTGDIHESFGWILAEADPESTSAVGYRRYLTDVSGFELVQVAVHSTTDSHLFYINNRGDYDYFRFRHLRDEVAPNVMFYNLFACSSMNLSRNLCLGALYALRGPYGLGAVGSTKTGAMLYFEDYYSQLDEGVSFGESLRRWLVQHGREQGHENWARSWFYGMTHYGDPTLTLKRGLNVPGYEADDSNGDNDNVIDAGERILLGFQIANRGEFAYEDIIFTLHSDDPYFELLENQGVIGEIRPDDIISTDPIPTNVRENCPDNHKATVEIRMTPVNGEQWRDQVELTIASPRLESIGFGLDETEGDDDGWIEPGETGVISVWFRNSGGDDMNQPAAVEFISRDQMFEALDSVGYLPPIPAGDIGNMQKLNYRISPDAEGLSAVYTQVKTRVNDIERGRGVIVIPISQDFSLEDDLEESPIWMNHYSLAEGYMDVWDWVEDAGIDGGGISFSGPDTIEYPPHADAAFELPLMMIEDDAVLEIRHRMRVEANYDGGVVEVDRGEGWQRAVPEGGYNGFSVDNGSYPGGECWNGEFDWTESRIPLGGPAGPLRVRLRFASDNGIEGEGWFIDWIRLSGTPMDVREVSPSPEEFELQSVFPNPFNSTTTIEYRLPEKSDVRLQVFDIKGRIVETLVAERQNAGSYVVNWNAGTAPAGLYLCRIEAGSFKQSKKLILVK